MTSTAFFRSPASTRPRACSDEPEITLVHDRRDRATRGASSAGNAGWVNQVSDVARRRAGSSRHFRNKVWWEKKYVDATGNGRSP